MATCVALLVVVGVVAGAGAAAGALQHPLELRGYFCSSCAGNTNPMALWGSIHQRYTTVIVAFVGYVHNLIVM